MLRTSLRHFLGQIFAMKGWQSQSRRVRAPRRYSGAAICAVERIEPRVLLTPVLAGVSGNQTYAQASSALGFASSLTISDSSSSTLTSATVFVTNWQDGDRLSYLNGYALQHSFAEDLSAHTATLTFSGTGTVAAYQATLQTLGF